MADHELRVGPIPHFVDVRRLLGPTGADELDGRGWALELDDDGRCVWAHARLDRERAADLAARLRGLRLDDRAVRCEIEPPLRRPQIRAARTIDARRRRETTPGFERRGARLDEEGRYSLTPERLASHVARAAQGRAVVDAGCGAGGNAIGFAREGCAVTAIELDAGRLELARHNAALYGVGDRVRFVHGDAIELAAGFADREAILFVDPPWGRDWSERRCAAEDFPLLAALRPLASRYWQLWAKLPPAFATDTLAGAQAEAVFGAAAGDERRIKFLILRVAG